MGVVGGRGCLFFRGSVWVGVGSASCWCGILVLMKFKFIVVIKFCLMMDERMDEPVK